MTNKEWKKWVRNSLRNHKRIFPHATHTHTHLLRFRIFFFSFLKIFHWIRVKDGCIRNVTLHLCKWYNFYTSFIRQHTHPEYFYVRPIIIRVVAWGEFPVSNRLIFSMGFHIKINRANHRSESISGFQSFSILKLYKFALHTQRIREVKGATTEKEKNGRSG